MKKKHRNMLGFQNYIRSNKKIGAGSWLTLDKSITMFMILQPRAILKRNTRSVLIIILQVSSFLFLVIGLFSFIFSFVVDGRVLVLLVL